ncbi:MAG: hypothetical protein N2036_14415 [Bryobacteraceae bacterium]|nr:hypothetical protein [Bryobacteraceae bacterium]
MLVDAQHGRAARRVPLAELPPQAGLEIALDSGRADALAAAQKAAVDAVQVQPEDLALEGLAGPLPGLDAGEALAEAPAAVPALELAGLQLDDDMPQPPILMAHSAVAPALAAQPHAATVGAGCGSGMPDPHPHLPRGTLDPGNLVTGQTQNKLRVDQNVSPKIVLSILRTRAAPVFDQEPHSIQNPMFSCARRDVLQPADSEVRRIELVQRWPDWTLSLAAWRRIFHIGYGDASWNPETVPSMWDAQPRASFEAGPYRALRRLQGPATGRAGAIGSRASRVR